MNTCSIQVTQLSPLRNKQISKDDARMKKKKKRREREKSEATYLNLHSNQKKKKKKNERNDKTSGPNSVCLIN